MYLKNCENICEIYITQKGLILIHKEFLIVLNYSLKKSFKKTKTQKNT